MPLANRLSAHAGMLKGIIITCLFLLYPYLVYQGIENGLAWLVPVLFSGIFLYRAWRSDLASLQLSNALIAIGLLLGAYFLQSLTAKVLPVLIQLMLMALFGRTLLKTKGPSFIERVVRLQFPEFPPAVSQYCWQLTLVWTVFFASNAVIVTALAIWGSGYGWALYNGFIIYVLIGVLAIGEYIYRRIRFADLSIMHEGIPDAKATIKALIINGRKAYLETMEHSK